MCRSIKKLRAFTDEDAVVAGMVLRPIEAFKAVGHHMFACGKALKRAGMGCDRGAAEPVDTVLDALKGASKMSGDSVYTFSLGEPAVDFLKIDDSFRVVMDGKGPLGVGLPAGIAAEARDGSYDQGVVGPYAFPVAPILIMAIVVVAAARVRTERWLHGRYLHGDATRSIRTMLAEATRFGELTKACPAGRARVVSLLIPESDTEYAYG